MNMGMELANINWLAALAATTVSFLIGGCRYSPLLFGRFLPDLMAGTESPGGESPVGASHYVAAVFTTAFALLWLAAKDEKPIANTDPKRSLGRMGATNGR